MFLNHNKEKTHIIDMYIRSYVRKREGLSFEMIGPFGPKKTHRSLEKKLSSFVSLMCTTNGVMEQKGNLETLDFLTVTSLAPLTLCRVRDFPRDPQALGTPFP